MAASVAREKRHFVTLQPTNDVVIGRRAKRRFHRDFALAGEARHRVKTAAAYDADFGQIQKMCIRDSSWISRLIGHCPLSLV